MLPKDSGLPHLCKFPPHYKHHSPPNCFMLLQTPSSSTKLFEPGAPTQVKKKKKFSSNLPYDFWLFKGFLFSPAGEEDQSKIL